MNQILHQLKNQKGLFCTMVLLFLTSYAFSQVNVILSPSNPVCGGIASGSIIAHPSGGQSPYSYYWSNGATTQSIQDLMTGFYSVTVTDVNGATATSSITLTAPTEVSGNISISGSNSPFTLTGQGNGGVPPYTYSWSTGQSGSVINNVTNGSYCVTILDNNLCGVVKCIDVANCNVNVVITVNHVSCPGSNDGTARAIVSGGTGPYTYQWDNGGTGQMITGLSQGVYMVTVTDANGCTGNDSALVSGPGGMINLNVNGANPSCAGSNNGTANANATGGVGPYTFNWSNGQTGSTISGLIAGTYYVTLTDANGCQQTGNITLSNQGNLNVNVTSTGGGCNGGNASATANVNGGSGSYSYTWSNGANTRTISNLSSGTYTVTVNDNNANCSTTGSVTINSGVQITGDIAKQDITCFGANNGSILVSGWGGTPLYTYAWSTGFVETEPFPNAGSELTNLSAGLYSVTITDANNCTITSTIIINQPPQLVVNVNGTDANCGSNSGGSANASVTGGTPGYTYAWSNGANTPTITNLTQGVYTVTVTDANFCSRTATVAINAGGQVNTDIVSTHPTCFGANNGSILVTGWGGTAPYTFFLSNGQSQAEPFPNSGVTFSNLSAGTYTVSLIDANGCTSSTTAFLTQPAQLFLSANGTDASCGSNGGGTATAFANGGTPGYNYSWSNGANTSTITNLTAGTYTVTVTDANFCSRTATVVINASGQVNTDILTTNPTCFAANNGSILVTGWGGTAPYTFFLSNGQSQAEPFPNSGVTFSNLSAGTYTVSLIDANGCTSSTMAFLTQPAQLIVNTNSTDANCGSNGGGTATAFASGGTPGYSYAWSNGANTPTINNLTAGTYTVTVTDANFCTRTTGVTINSNGQIAINISKTHVICFGDSNGTITVTGSGGTGPYTFFLNNGQTLVEPFPNAGVTFSNLSSGTYNVTVTDASGCTATGTALIGQPPLLLVSTTGTDAGCGSNSGGSATAFASGGTPGYSYVWSNGGNSQTINNLTSGTYTVTVTDANFCIKIASVTINGGGQINVDIIKTNVTCFGGNNGTITATGWGGTAPYTFSLSDGQTMTEPFPNSGVIFGGLSSGVYNISIIDANSCTGSATIVITQPTQLIANISSTNASCNANDGTASTNANGGTPPYTYFWNTGANTANLSNLGAGTYIVTITDANGCTAASTTNVMQSQGFDLNVTSTNTSCANTGTASATAQVTGGAAPFNYQWSNSGSSQTISNLNSGTYTVTVTDNNGCVEIGSTTVAPGSDLTTDIAKQDVACFGESTGSVLVSGWGGTPLYTYNWSTGLVETETSPNAGSELTGLAAGTYTVTVTDANGCMVIETIIINQPSQLSLNTIGTDATCSSNSGMANVVATGGTFPYTYQWSNGTTIPINMNLSPGVYTVTVTDANFCTETASVTIASGGGFTINITGTDILCSDASSGSATVTVNGGTAPFSYNWSTGQNTSQITNLSPGGYTVTVTDNLGCSQVGSVVITQSSNVIVIVTGNNTTCGASNSGTAITTVTGGTAPFSYNWSNGAATSTLSNLEAGTYIVTVTDTNGCTDTGSITISNSNLMINVIKDNVECFGENTGSATLMLTGGQAPYTFNWSNGSSSQTVMNLAADTYTVTVTDVSGCMGTATVIITQPPALIVVINSNNPGCSGSNTGSAMASASGGTSPYTYNWSNGETTASISNLGAGTYTVTVTDANGCIETETTTISQGSTLTLSTSSTPASCGQNSGTASVTANGTAPYTYSWSNGGSTATINNLSAGTYTVSVTDANGCFDTATVTVSGENSPTVSVTTSGSVCDGTSTGTATANASGGQSPYTYNWSNGETTMMITDLNAGTYIVTITDANGCTDTASGSINNSAGLQINITAIDISCNGLNDGSLSTTVSGGTAPFSYNWSNGSNNSQQNNVSEGTYTVTVTDANGCTGTASATIDEPSEIVVNLQEIDETCGGASNGRITASVNGGTPNYSYNWSNGANTATIQNLSPSTYQVTVTDAAGCTEVASATIAAGTNITATVTTQTTCQNSNNGSATANGTGGQTPYSYNWSNGSSSQTINNLNAGTYTVTITDANGCQDTDSANVAASSSPSCYIQILSPVDNGNDGIIQVQANGGQSPYTYNWSNGETSQSIGGLSPGTYFVTITDANGCTTNCNITLVTPAKIGDMVWNDYNQNGIMDSGEPGIGGVQVVLTGTDNQGNSVNGTTFTGGDGKYIFTGLVPGNYKVTFDLDLGGFVPSPSNQGGNDQLDSDADPVTGMTQFINLSQGECDLSLDAGFYELCSNVTDPGAIGYDQNLCSGNLDPDPIISLAPASGGQGILEYIWMRANLNVPFNNSAWEIIPGETGESYDPGPINDNTYFARCVRRSGCTNYLETNLVHITVNSTVAIILGPDRVCQNDVVNYSAAVTSGADISYFWNFGSGASPSTANTSTANVRWVTTGVKQVTLTTNLNGCTHSATISVNVTTLPNVCGSGLVIDATVVNQRDVMVEWELPLSSSDSIMYYIERSPDGENFHEMGQTLDTKSEVFSMAYEYMDLNPKMGYGYYRVAYDDELGIRHYSNIEEVIIYGNDIIHVFPNPTVDEVNVEILDDYYTRISIEVIDALGRYLHRTRLGDDEFKTTIDLSPYPRGVYFLRINYSDVDSRLVKVVRR